MGFLHEIQIQTSGFQGAPGFTNLYFQTAILDDETAQFDAAFAFVQAMRPVFPEIWRGHVVASGRKLEETTGALATFTTAPVGDTAVQSGSADPGFGAGVAGAVIGWSTATINRARLVRGRTFVIPLARGQYDDDGTLKAVAISTLETAGQALIDSATGFCIWSRPRLGVGGKGCPVVSRRVNDRAAFLSSRRV